MYTKVIELQSYGRFRLLVSLMLLIIVTFALIILTNIVSAQQILHTKTLGEITKQTSSLDKRAQVIVGNSPIAIAIDGFTNTVYVVNIESDSVSVISGKKHTKIGEDIPVGDSPEDIYFNGPDTVYVAHPFSDSISVISVENNTKIKDITVGENPTDVYSDDSYTIYVANSWSNSVSVISGTNNTKIGEDIPVGDRPTAIAIQGLTDTVYVANSGSDSVSVIESIANKVVAGITIEINPFNSGYIECDGLKAPISQYFYVYPGAECIAKPNKGFEFLSWEENLKNDATQLLNSSRRATIFEDIVDSFHNMVNYLGIDNFLGVQKSVEPEAILKITKFGTFTANFRELPTPLPPEYWATLFGVVVTAFISSWLTPTLIGWRKAKKHQNKLNNYQNELKIYTMIIN